MPWTRAGRPSPAWDREAALAVELGPKRLTGPLEAYRVIFPLGLAFAIVGAAVWPLHVLGLIDYPGLRHASLMIQGFEQCFVLGFLLTAMPAFTHGPRCHPAELGLAVAMMVVFGAATLAGVGAVAQAAFLSSILLLWVAGIRRVAGNPSKPPEEFLFVAFGLALGAAGGILQFVISLGTVLPLPARFPERLVSLGMVLSLVIGVGSLLVPTFAGMRDPLAIPGVAGPHQRRGRRQFYGLAIVVLTLAFIAELLGQARIGAGLRAAAITTMGLWVWKLPRLPRRDIPGFALWASGWMVLIGLWAVVLLPMMATAMLHIVFIGGFGLLTLGIATRVVVAHGKHSLEIERRALDVWVLGFLAAALLCRLVADVRPDRAMHWAAASGVMWMLSWLLWAVRTLPALVLPRASR